MIERSKLSCLTDCDLRHTNMHIFIKAVFNFDKDATKDSALNEKTMGTCTDKNVKIGPERLDVYMNLLFGLKIWSNINFLSNA